MVLSCYSVTLSLLHSHCHYNTVAFDKGKREACSLAFCVALLTHARIQRFLSYNAVLEDKCRLPTAAVRLLTAVTSVSVQVRGAHEGIYTYNSEYKSLLLMVSPYMVHCNVDSIMKIRKS